jgi:hypothetical protein
MKNYFKWTLDSFKSVLKFLAGHPDEVSAIPEMTDDIETLNDAVVEIEVAEGIQTSNIEGVTEDTKQKKKTMAQTVIAKARKGLPMAKKANKPELVEKLDYRVYYIEQAPKADALARAKDIKKVLADNDTVFTNIKPADITAMVDAIKAYDESEINPRQAREHKKIAGTEALDAPFKKGNDSCDNIYDYFYGEYQLTKPDLVKELADLLGIEKEGVRHNTINATCVDGNPPAGAPTHLLQDVEMKLVELNLIVRSDINGLAHLTKFKHGTYHLEFSKAGFITKQMIVFIKRGQTVELEVVLNRVV